MRMDLPELLPPPLEFESGEEDEIENNSTYNEISAMTDINNWRSGCEES